MIKKVIWEKPDTHVIKVYLDNDPNPHFIAQREIRLLDALKECFS